MNHSTIARSLVRGIRLFVVAALLGAMVTIAAPLPVAHAWLASIRQAEGKKSAGPGTGGVERPQSASVVGDR